MIRFLDLDFSKQAGWWPASCKFVEHSHLCMQVETSCSVSSNDSVTLFGHVVFYIVEFKYVWLGLILNQHVFFLLSAV